jgi:RsiW-degrading membrane proteinase PrsW (M82 family)
MQPENLQNSMSSIGLGSSIATKVVAEPEKGQGKKYILAAITILGVVFLSLVVVVLISSALSPIDANGNMTLSFEGIVFAFIASFVAFIPAVFYILPLIWLDRYDPEPLWLLDLAFAWGALVAVIVSFIINTSVGSLVFAITRDPYTSAAISGVISAPVFEEASKGIGLLILLIFFRKYFG